MTPDQVAYATPAYAQPTSKQVGMAVAAMVLGILGIVFFWVPFVGLVVGILAIILGAVAIGQANRKPDLYGGKGMAITGLVLGIVQIAIWVLVWVFLAAMFAAIFG